MNTGEGSMAQTAARSWHAVEIVLDEAAGEAAQYALMEAGALGTEAREESSGLVRVVGYFETPPEREAIDSALRNALHIYALPASAMRETIFTEVAHRDWLAEWKRSWQPVAVGRRLVIAPPWSEVNEGPGQLTIRIEPGMAFGTGTHETTRLCLAAIESHFRGGSFLDVGTGTGILAIATAKLSPEARIEACDTDAAAVEIARKNACLNQVAERIEFRVGTVDNGTASATCVCANLTADVIIKLLPALLSATCGRLILSGMLDAQSHGVQSRLRELGASGCEVMREGEWVAMIA
ncbi:MAG: 50S ribosomal protein L11 methyltransferase [Pyrinomonadaceae bacterium]|nr:50S ribosomal protein L11 methyltransferase [Pyrinomonadaceae bacterium]